jgi:putative oxidoreductase
MDLALLVVRLVIGLLFAAHGSKKLFAVLGGPGFERTADSFDAIGLRPARVHARAAGTAETVGGALLAAGFLTPVGVALVITTMVAAIITVHLPKGIWNSEGGYEYPLVIIATAFVLAGVGPGQWSLDGALGIELASTGWALGALGVGVIAGLGAVFSGRSSASRGGRATPPQPAR